MARLHYGDEHIPFDDRRRARRDWTVDTTEADATGASVSVDTTIGRAKTADLTTAAGATYTFTITNTRSTAKSVITASIANVTNTAGRPVLLTVDPSVAGSIIFTIWNAHAADAFNGKLRVFYAIHGSV